MVKIGIYGRMNSGKSTLFNFLLGAQNAIVSPTAGTTTDPVRRSYELLGFGAVTFIDTAGFDDCGSEIAEQRVQKSLATIDEVDVALFVPMVNGQLDKQERDFVADLDIPFILVEKPFADDLFSKIKSALSFATPAPSFFGRHLSTGQRVLLVCPIDSESPAGRLILPQVQALRAALDINAYAMIIQPAELKNALTFFKPDLVVIDSQIFDVASGVVPPTVPLTSFSILLSESKGDIKLYAQGVESIDGLKESDKILLIEHCSHGVSCDDIARVKIPHALQSYTGCNLDFTIVSGRVPLPADLSVFALAVQCGGCMVGARALRSRIGRCQAAGLPITSYGLLLKHIAAK